MKPTFLNHPQGEALLKAINNSFNKEDRRALLRILVSEMLTIHCDYPSEKAKTALAKAIVIDFPTLKDKHAKKGYVGTL